MISRALTRCTGLATVAFALLIQAGCGVKLVYNNAERFLLWEVEDIVDLDTEQRVFLKQRFKHVMYWHRSSELPLYADGLRELEAVFQRGIETDDLRRFEDLGEEWFDRIAAQLGPAAAEILLSLSDEQWRGLADNLAKSNEEYIELADQSDEEIREYWYEEFADSLKTFVGKLTAEQEKYIWERRLGYLPEYDLYLDFRRRWQAELLSLQHAVDDPDALEARIIKQFGHSEAWHGAEYAALEAANRKLYVQMAIDLNGMFTERQLAHLSDELLGLAEVFDELYGQADGMAKPERGCLIRCSETASTHEIRPAAFTEPGVDSMKRLSAFVAAVH